MQVHNPTIYSRSEIHTVICEGAESADWIYAVNLHYH